MRSTDRMRLPGAVLVLVLALAGCTPATVVVQPTVAPMSSPAASPTPTPSATPTKPELSELVISADGLGPVPMGTDLYTLDPAVSIFVNEPVDCGAGPMDSWEASYPDRPLGNGVRAFEVETTTGPLEYVLVFHGGPHTAEGIRVGSTFDELTGAYPATQYVGAAGFERERYALYGAPANLFFDVVTTDYDLRPRGEIFAIGITLGDPTSAAGGHPPGPSCL